MQPTMGLTIRITVAVNMTVTVNAAVLASSPTRARSCSRKAEQVHSVYGDGARRGVLC